MMALAANQLQHILPSFDPTNAVLDRPYESDASIEENEDDTIEEDFDVENEDATPEITISSNAPSTIPNAVITTTTPTISNASSQTTTISQDRPNSPSLQDVPSLVLSFKSNTYSLFSPHSTSSSDGPEVLFADKLFLYKAPLQLLMFELKEHFSVSTDVSLDFPELQLSFGLNMVYSQKVTLAHVQLLTQGLENHNGKPVPFSATLVECPNAFLSQYNRLIELAQQIPSKHNVVFTSSSTGIPLPSPAKTFASSSPLAPSSVETSATQVTEQTEPEVEPEVEEDVVEPNTESNVETVEANANETYENETTDESSYENEVESEVVDEEDMSTEDGTVEQKAEEAVEEQTLNSEDVEVEFDEINTELTVADDVVYAAAPKLHARRWDDDHGPNEVDELEHKRQRFSSVDEKNEQQEADSTETTNTAHHEEITTEST
eukprot:TRINITY_DN1028_c0_g1_i1.p1 TRINITY_DN1028_c0_g1~~TRINITY_DN1028_c0_g1_i1.p1  ORF type:complete len:435 (+),score=97.81 TRINITY_DN1028_c0_g1_i1:400-1704(+)